MDDDSQSTPGLSGLPVAFGLVLTFFVGGIVLLGIVLSTPFGSNSPLAPLFVLPVDLPALVALPACLGYAWRLQLLGRDRDARSLLVAGGALALANLFAFVALVSMLGPLILLWPLLLGA